MRLAAFVKLEFQFLCWSPGHVFLASKLPGAPLIVAKFRYANV